MGIEFLGASSLDAGLTFEGTPIGGLSAITYDPTRRVFYALSDNRGQLGPPRFYTLTVDLLMES